VIIRKLLILVIPLVAMPFRFHHRSAAQKDLTASVLLHMKVAKKAKMGKSTETVYEYFGCSGTYIAPHTILTAAHCISNMDDQVWARGPYNLVGYPVHVVYWDRKADLALLDAPFGHPYVKIGSLPERGDRVLNIGSPEEFEFVESEGLIGQVDFHMHGFSSDYLITTAMANPGSSGGGAFNDRGELIGVNTMIIGMFGWSGLTMAVNTDSILLFLGQALKLYHHYGVN
jgi:S1-C subfamily serine protease